jgi:hypothetical protein
VAEREERDFWGIRIASVDWPIVSTDFPERRVPDQALRSVLDHLESLMNEAAKGREKLFLITDLTRMREMPSASQRHLAAAWLKRTDALLRVATVGTAHVTPSPLLRGILTAVFWITAPPKPSTFVATLEEAMLRGIRMLEAEGARLPPRLTTYRESRGTGRAG